MKTRVLLLITDLRLGGTPRMVQALATGLDRERFDVEVASLMEGSSITDQLLEAGIPCQVLGMRNKWDPRPLWRLLRYLRENRFDLIHAWLFHANNVAKVLGKLAGVPRILTSERGVETNKSRGRVLLDRWTHPLMDALVVNAEAIRDVQRTREGIPERKIRTIPNGLPLEAFPAALMVGPPPPRILTVARFDPVKGHEDLLAAARLVLERRPDARFLWVGAGSELEPMRRRVREAGLEAAIDLPGETDDVLPHLHRSHLFVLPSHQEGMPGSVLEAMAVRLPVIATRVGGLPEIVEDGITGHLVPPRDPAALARVILEMLEDSPRCQAMGEAGRRRVERHFSRETFIKAHEKLYRELVGIETGACEDVV